jgi:hypothetical protein
LGETRVDLLHLLEDLRDAYPGSLEETILTEILANALDSGASNLRLEADPTSATLLAVDDGSGMTRRELSRYHDLATSHKRRGHGIGFAGVGIKLGLLACNEVITETCRSGKRAATSWRLANRTRAPWTWVEPPHFMDGDGTAVQLQTSNALSHLLDPGFLEVTVLRHFQPLFEPEFLDILAPAYPNGLSITVNGSAVVGPIRPAPRSAFAIRVGRQRRASGIGYLARHDAPLPEHERGLAVSTLGKVIRRGWDWIGVIPSEPDRIEGLVEVPALAEALTLNKGDFLRHGPRGALYLSYRKAIQEAVTTLFGEWGAPAALPRKTPRTRPIERDLRKVLGELADQYPVLATLAERRAGGQRRLPLGEGAKGGVAGHWSGDPIEITAFAENGRSAHEPPDSSPTEPPSITTPAQPSRTPGSEAREEADSASASERQESATVRLPGSARRKRPATLSLEIRFESLPGELALGRLVESIVWINESHPAYRRAVMSRAEGYHIALAVASTLAPFAVETHAAQRFVSQFLARWGEAAVRTSTGAMG